MTTAQFYIGDARLAEMLTEARFKAGLTQRTVARRLALTQSFVFKYEHAERRLTVPEFLAVCRALGVDPHRMIDRLLGPRNHAGREVSSPTAGAGDGPRR